MHSLTKIERYVLLACGLFILFFIYAYFHIPPKDFPLDTVVTVESGESLQSITNILYQTHVIKSPFVFRTTVILLGGEKRVIAGDYLLDKHEGSVDLAYRLVHGQFHLPQVKTTVPEGWSVFQIGDLLERNLLNFDENEFLTLAKSKEGYLFPDTYFLSPAIKPDAVIERMQNNFQSKIAPLEKQILASGHSEHDVLVMASILENEARTPESRRSD